MPRHPGNNSPAQRQARSSGVEFYSGELHITLAHSMLVGGRADPPPFVDAASARAADGRPVIPGSTLRGALREALGRLSLHRGLEVCTPFQSAPGCAPGSLCPVCRIFGSSGADRPGLLEPISTGHHRKARSTGLAIDDGIPGSWAGAAADIFNLRHGVGMDRRRGVAADGRLYVREVAEAPGSLFVARVEGWLLPRDAQLVSQAARLVEAIGNSQSRGIGWVSMVLDLSKETGGKSAVLDRKYRAGRFKDGRALLHVEAETDLSLGGTPLDGNHRHTLLSVPGSSMRGAMGWALADSGLPVAHPDAEMARLFNEPGAFTVSDLHPAVGNGSAELAMPAPRSLLACPMHRDTIFFDTMLRDALGIRMMERHGGKPTGPPRCPACHRLLKPISGFVDPSGGPVPSPGLRLVTRLARNPRTGSAAAGMLHAREQIVAGTCFTGTVSGLDKVLLEGLWRLRGSLRLGGLRRRGLGRVKIQILQERSMLRQRLKSYQRKTAALATPQILAAVGLSGQVLLHVVARTDVNAPVPSGQAGEWMARHLFPSTGGQDVSSATVVGTRLRTVPRSGWNDASGRIRPLQEVIAAGSGWLLALPRDCFDALLNDPDALRRLQDAESVGLGNDTQLGMGRLHFCPDFPLEVPK